MAMAHTSIPRRRGDGASCRMVGMGVAAFCAVTLLSCAGVRPIQGWMGTCRGYVGDFIGRVTLAPTMPYHPAEDNRALPHLRTLETFATAQRKVQLSYRDLSVFGPYLGLTRQPSAIFIEVDLGSTARFETLAHELGHTTQPPMDLYHYPFAKEWWAETWGVVVQKVFHWEEGQARSALWVRNSTHTGMGAAVFEEWAWLYANRLCAQAHVWLGMQELGQ